MPRIYQDVNFTVAEVEGCVVTRVLAGVCDNESDDRPYAIFARVEDPPQWHRFFLDFGLGFWEVYGDEDIEEELAGLEEEDGARVVDYAANIGGVPQQILRAEAIAAPNTPSTIRICFASGAQMHLVPDSMDFDFNFHVVFSGN